MVANTAQVQDATVYDEEYKSKVNDCEANICKVEIYLKDYETNETIHYLRETFRNRETNFSDLKGGRKAGIQFHTKKIWAQNFHF